MGIEAELVSPQTFELLLVDRTGSSQGKEGKPVAEGHSLSTLSVPTDLRQKGQLQSHSHL